MSERIYKLQPNRTLALRGFDHLGASAALHSASASSFKVSGVFRDPSDFAVLVLHDADNFYDHPRLKYLPDFDFSGLTLQFDVHYEGLMPLSSPKYATIDWPFLDVIRKDGSSAKIRLSDHGAAVSAGDTKAEASFTIVDEGLREFDRLTLWYLNIAYDYLVPKVTCAFEMLGQGVGTAHTVTVAGNAYTYTEVAGDTNTSVAQGVVNALLLCPDVEAARGDGSPDLGSTNQVKVRSRRTDGQAMNVVYRTNSQMIYGVGASTVAQALAAQVNGTNWQAAGALIPLQAEPDGANLRLIAGTPGIDGNMIAMYAIAKNTRLHTTTETVQFSGGESNGTWRIKLDFSALGIAQVRLMWLTFAPPLANAAEFESTEWKATFTNWALTGPEQTRALPVAGPRSVRVEETDTWCSFTGSWSVESGFFSGGFARASSTAGNTVTIRYTSPATHDLYVGTSLYKDRGAVLVRLDGDPASRFDCFLDNEPAVNTRRRLRSNVSAGDHTVTLQLESNKPFYLDFLEAVVASDVPEALPVRPNLSPALDYSTDHTYKLPPARIMWNFDKLGFTGPMNEYAGVFWWNQRTREGAAIPSAAVTFSGNYAPGDQVFIDIGGQECGKSVFPNETNSAIARHFSQFINSNYVGVWASASGDTLTITSRSPEPAYSYTLSTRKVTGPDSTGAVNVTGTLTGGVPGKWVVDPSQAPALNRGARDWHTDLFGECAARNREIVIAASMELVNPPEGFAAVYWDGVSVETDVGFGSLKSTHCAFVPPVLEYQKSVFETFAGLMSAAGLTPNVQFGEFLWWFFTNKREGNPNGGMAFYHPSIVSAAQAQLGRPLVRFTGPNDDPLVNGGADAAFLRACLRDHVNALIAHVRAAHPATKFEVLFPYDVNHPTPAGIHQLGGKLNRYINLPVEWESKPGSNLDCLKTEALDFGAWSRDLDLAKTAIRLPMELGWPRDSVRHLVPIFRAGYPWEKEVALAEAAGVHAVNLWAFDHICIYGYPPLPASVGRSMRIS